MSDAQLETSPFFHTLDRRAQRRILEIAVPRDYNSGTVLFREGDRSDHVQVITRGKVKLASLQPTVGEVIFGHRGPGEPLGVLSALDGRPRSADGIAVTDVSTLLLSGYDFTRYLADLPSAGVALLKTFAGELRSGFESRLDLERPGLVEG